MVTSGIPTGLCRLDVPTADSGAGSLAELSEIVTNKQVARS